MRLCMLLPLLAAPHSLVTVPVLLLPLLLLLFAQLLRSGGDGSSLQLPEPAPQ